MTGLRVIGGKARGRKLRAVPGDTTRPVTDQVKEACFNIIGGDIVNATFLDLFAGTGSIGIEALSRGAAFVRFIDLNRQPVETVRANLTHCGLEQNAEVMRADAFALLERSPDRSFDYVYIAPPQYKGMWARTMLVLDAYPTWMSDDAWVIVQIHPMEYEALALKSLVEFDQRRYGSTLLAFYERV
jgi:16S rRNA (guanine(966)-N(2))-methyltransferase RsmD